MTKKQLLILENILLRLERGQDFLMDANTEVCRKVAYATTTDCYTRSDGAVLRAIDRQIGSDLALLHTGIAQLGAFIKTHDKGRKS